MYRTCMGACIMALGACIMALGACIMALGACNARSRLTPSKASDVGSA
jgi:hypothetical protein